jgi:hypothetical protein
LDSANLKSNAAVSGLHPKEEMRMLSSVFAGLQIYFTALSTVALIAWIFVIAIPVSSAPRCY